MWSQSPQHHDDREKCQYVDDHQRVLDARPKIVTPDIDDVENENHGPGEQGAMPSFRIIVLVVDFQQCLNKCSCDEAVCSVPSLPRKYTHPSHYIGQKFLNAWRGKLADPVVLATRCRSPIVQSQDKTGACLNTKQTYMDAISARLSPTKLNERKVQMKLQNRPARPPSISLSLTVRYIVRKRIVSNFPLSVRQHKVLPY